MLKPILFVFLFFSLFLDTFGRGSRDYTFGDHDKFKDLIRRDVNLTMRRLANPTSSRFWNDMDSSTIIPNEYASIIVRSASKHLELFHEPMNLQDIHIPISLYHGSINLTDGKLHNTKSVHAAGDSQLLPKPEVTEKNFPYGNAMKILQSNHFNLTVPVAFGPLLFNFKSKPELNGIKSEGQFEATLKNLQGDVLVVMDPKTKMIRASKFTLMNKGDYDYKFTGNASGVVIDTLARVAMYIMADNAKKTLAEATKDLFSDIAKVVRESFNRYPAF